MTGYLLIALCFYLMFCWWDGARPLSKTSLMLVVPALFWPVTALLLVCYGVYVVLNSRRF